MVNKTNKQILSKAVKELNDIDLVFMREMLLTACEDVLNNKEQLMKEMQNGIISPNLYIECTQHIHDHIKFD
jgi:flagellar biosynthesis regulator FlaF